MATTTRKPSAVPWLVAAGAGVVLAALLLLYFAFLLPSKGNTDDIGGLTSDERSAITAAATRASDIVSISRANFDKDWARAVDGTTGTLKTQLLKSKAATKAQLVAGKYDIGATVTHTALEGPTVKGAKGYIAIVSLEGFRSTAKQATVPNDLEVTVVRSHGKWLAIDVSAINLAQ